MKLLFIHYNDRALTLFKIENTRPQENVQVTLYFEKLTRPCENSFE